LSIQEVEYHSSANHHVDLWEWHLIRKVNVGSYLSHAFVSNEGWTSNSAHAVISTLQLIGLHKHCNCLRFSGVFPSTLCALYKFTYLLTYLLSFTTIAISFIHRLGSVKVRTLDLRSRGRWFNSRSGRYQVVSTWMGDCLRTGKPSRYITNTKVNSAFHPSGVGTCKSSLSVYVWCYGGARSPVSGGG